MSDKRAAKTKSTVSLVFVNFFLFLFSLTCVFPFIWMFYSSFKTQREFGRSIISLPSSLDFTNFTSVFEAKDNNLIQAMINSLRVTVLSLFFIVLFGFILGYILGRIRFRGNRVVYLILMLGMLIPVHALMAPVYILFSGAGLTNNLNGLTIPYIAFGLPIPVFLVESYVKGIPVSLEEAAAIDGSGFTRSMFSIILPICRPVLATAAIIQAFYCWNEFLFARILLQGNLQTVTVALANMRGQHTANFPKIFATMLISMIPVIIFYFSFSKQIIKGMVAGATKG